MAIQISVLQANFWANFEIFPLKRTGRSHASLAISANQKRESAVSANQRFEWPALEVHQLGQAESCVFYEGLVQVTAHCRLSLL